jgi:hypothetical protein
MDRDKLKLRNRIDREQELAHAELQSPEQGLMETVELSDTVRALATAAAMTGVVDDIQEKAWLYVRPLRALRPA